MSGGRWWPVPLMALLGFLAFACITNAWAQGTDEFESLREQIIHLQGQGKHAEAIPVAKRYIARARQRRGEKRIEFAVALTSLAVVYQHRAATAMLSRCTVAR